MAGVKGGVHDFAAIERTLKDINLDLNQIDTKCDDITPMRAYTMRQNAGGRQQLSTFARKETVGQIDELKKLLRLTQRGDVIDIAVKILYESIQRNIKRGKLVESTPKRFAHLPSWKDAEK